MGKYSSSMHRQPNQEPRLRRIHPIWRGIGFIFIILIPIMAYYTTLVVLDMNNQKGWFQIPVDLYYHNGDPLLYVKIMGTVAFGFIFYAIFMLITFIIISMFAPPRYGPLDVPPMHYRRVKR
ncbi:MAG TPA: hypothetical protein VKF38_11895 [Anaerolineaceae bacterium]|nr:hypothetical protein [Anaerolineaceae bacterium]